MSAIKGARERARADVTAAIKEEARRQLIEQGAAKLSLRAVARELGMVSSALYRYFPSRDELLTALIIDAYDGVGAAAESALAAAPAGDATLRWTAVCRALRQWALEHPHEYALIYGSPVPGYAAPEETTGHASRVGLALIAVVQEAQAAGTLREPGEAWPAAVLRDAEQLRQTLGIGLSAQVTAGILAAWPQLYGLITFELFGQFNNLLEAREEFYIRAVERLAGTVGLVPQAVGAD